MGFSFRCQRQNFRDTFTQIEETSAVEQQPPFSLLIIGKKGDKQVVDSLGDSEMTVTKKQTF